MNSKTPQTHIDLDAIKNNLNTQDIILTAADCNRIHFGGKHTVLTPKELSMSQTSSNIGGDIGDEGMKK